VTEDVFKRKQAADSNTIPDVVPRGHTDSDDSEQNDDIEPHRPSFFMGPAHLVTSMSPQRRPRSTFVYRGYRAQNERNIFTQLSLIVIAFMIGYIPVTVYLVWTTATTHQKNDATYYGSIDYWFGVVSYLCLRLSECMNPVMYNLGSSNIRQATKKLLKLK